MATETGDAFERAAEKEHRIRTGRQRAQRGGRYQYGSLAWARASLHSKVNTLVFLSMALAVHWYFVQRVTNWVIAHGIIIALVFLGLVHAWGAQRVAEAELREKNRE